MLERFRHVKRGTTYDVLGHAELQMSVARPCVEGDRLVVYRSENGKLWCRHQPEFYDGRFERMPRGRLWWPQSYLDEAMPNGTKRPEDWIVGAFGEGTFVVGPEERDERLSYRCTTAAPGDTVEFSWSEDRGSVVVIIQSDGTWRGTEPDDYSQVWEDGESESCGDSIDEVVRNHLEYDPLDVGDSREITLCFCKWGSDTLRLALDTEGTPTFVSVDGGDLHG